MSLWISLGVSFIGSCIGIRAFARMRLKRPLPVRMFFSKRDAFGSRIKPKRFFELSGRRWSYADRIGRERT
jgi:hypothetical protein